MKRRDILAGLGAIPALHPATTGVAAKPKDKRGKRGKEAPVENVDTGDTYDSIQVAVDEAGEGHTIRVAVGTVFDEDVAIDTDGISLEARFDTRLQLDEDAETVVRRETGRSTATVDDDAANLLLTTRGKARPTVTGSFETVVVDARGTSQPEIEADVDALYVTWNGNAAPAIEGNVANLVVGNRGKRDLYGSGTVGSRSTVPDFNLQPTIRGTVEIDGEDVTVDGFDVETETVGIDVGTGSARTVRLSNNTVSGVQELERDDGVVQAGAGIRIRVGSDAEAVAIGGVDDENVLKDNYVGVLVDEADGSTAVVDASEVRANNRFRNNKLAVAPPSPDADEARVEISDGLPREVSSAELDPDDPVVADLEGARIDGDATLRMESLSVKRATAGTVDFTFDPDVTLDDPQFPDAYAPVADGLFEIQTDLGSDEVDLARFVFAVDRDAVEDPESVTLQRRVDGTFEELRTVLVSETDATCHYAAFSPGFSFFQVTEFDESGVGGAGREIAGRVLLPETAQTVGADGVGETFLRIETSRDVDALEFESAHPAVSIDDEITVDLRSDEPVDLPMVSGDLFTITNAGSESVTVRTTVGLSNVDAYTLSEGFDFDNGLSNPIGMTTSQRGVRLDQRVLNAEQQVFAGVQIDSTDPETQFWFQMLLPTLIKSSGELYDATRYNDNTEGGTLPAECANEESPVLYPLAYGYNDPSFWEFLPWVGDGVPDWIPSDVDSDTRVFRIPATLAAHWHDEASSGLEGYATVVIDGNAGPEGELVGIYDKRGEEPELWEPPVASVYHDSDLEDGTVQEEMDLIVTSASDCDPETMFNLVSMDQIYSDIGEIVLDVELTGDLREIAGQSQFTHSRSFQTLGDTTEEVVEKLLEETFQKFASGVIGAALPGPVMTYRAARALAAGSAAGGSVGVELAGIWAGANVLTPNQALTPQSLFANALAEGMVGYSTSTEIDLSRPLEKGPSRDVGAAGPSFYLSTDPEPACLQADRRTLTVEGQLTGGPVILMGLDSEEVPGDSSHGPPSEHAKMVASIRDSVTNGGEGILVLGGDPDSNRDIRSYWETDIGSDPRVDEDVTFVNGPADIRSVDLEGYAMIGIVSSDGEIRNGLTDSENQALIARQHDIAEFVNGGGGLLGKTQEDLRNPWDYISEIADLEAIETGFSSVDVTQAGQDLGLTQSGMNGWCCYHEAFVEDSVPDFLTVLIRNAQRSDRPPAAIGGDSVVIQTAVDLEVTTPGVVAAGEFDDLEVRLANRLNEQGEDVRLQLQVTNEAGLSEGDAELGGDRTLEPSGDALTADLTDEPIAFTPDLDTTIDLGLAFHEAGTYDVQVHVVTAETGETVVSLPFGVKSVDSEIEVCD
ncbi:hypothetical protein [Natrinema salaciae]|uniref:Uncharacterized protein n=1 Tax=Natrinema salaciae TaxID=1186196 RepID=A0A1H9ESL6_9EURY|nr:hypothetical protein [Natrinema salaciae]SEQ28233.1 hypothetical protein SAMN04489841_1362 [Natrinema salaciae]